MNIAEMAKLLRLSSAEIQRLQSYMEKAENSEVRYCETHDREYFDFEYEGMCAVCYEERMWSRYEHGDEQAGEILKENGRLNE